MHQSANLAFHGFLNAAGLFLSKKKCPLHANGYTTNGTKGANNQISYLIINTIKANKGEKR